jgi:hypothetical protein
VGLSEPLDRIELWLRHLARGIVLDLGVDDVACVHVDLRVPPAGIEWIGCERLIMTVRDAAADCDVTGARVIEDGGRRKADQCQFTLKASCALTAVIGAATKVVTTNHIPPLKQRHNSIVGDLAVAFRQSDTSANFHFAFQEVAWLG